MKAIAQERRRFGYRRLHVLLKREGNVINHKRLFRLYREEKLAVRRPTATTITLQFDPDMHPDELTTPGICTGRSLSVPALGSASTDPRHLLAPQTRTTENGLPRHCR